MAAPDFPFDEVVAECQSKAAEGARMYQKFSCSKCGQRLTMETPNTFWHEGSCDSCGTVTDIKAQGCNYVLVMGPAFPWEGEVPRRITICEPQKARE